MSDAARPRPLAAIRSLSGPDLPPPSTLQRQKPWFVEIRDPIGSFVTEPHAPCPLPPLHPPARLGRVAVVDRLCGGLGTAVCAVDRYAGVAAA